MADEIIVKSITKNSINIQVSKRVGVTYSSLFKKNVSKPVKYTASYGTISTGSFYTQKEAVAKLIKLLSK